VAHFNGLQSYQ